MEPSLVNKFALAWSTEGKNGRKITLSIQTHIACAGQSCQTCDWHSREQTFSRQTFIITKEVSFCEYNPISTGHTATLRQGHVVGSNNRRVAPSNSPQMAGKRESSQNFGLPLPSSPTCVVLRFWQRHRCRLLIQTSWPLASFSPPAKSRKILIVNLLLFPPFFLDALVSNCLLTYANSANTINLIAFSPR